MHHPPLEQLRKYIGGPATVGVTADDADSIYEDKISGQTFATEAEALESSRLSYLAAGGQPTDRLSDLQSRYLGSQ
jgi:hypothetical protein